MNLLFNFIDIYADFSQSCKIIKADKMFFVILMTFLAIYNVSKLQGMSKNKENLKETRIKKSK